MMTERPERARPASRPAIPPFTIRAAKAGDRDGVAELLGASYGTLLARDYPPELLAAVMPRITVPQPALLASGSYYLADCGGGVLLAAGGWSHAAPGGGNGGSHEVGHMRHVAVSPVAVGAGVGRALVEHILFEAARAGVRRMMCFSTLTARRFYAKLGFADQGEISVTMEPGLVLPSVQMVREM